MSGKNITANEYIKGTKLDNVYYEYFLWENVTETNKQMLDKLSNFLECCYKKEKAGDPKFIQAAKNAKQEKHEFIDTITFYEDVAAFLVGK